MCCNRRQCKEGLITLVAAFFYKLCTASESTNHAVRLEMSLQFLDLYVCTVCYALGRSDITTAVQFTYNLQVFVDCSWSLAL